MNPKVGTVDRVVQLIVGAILIAFAPVAPETGYNQLGWICVVPLVTAPAGRCPIYRLFALRTCSGPKQV